VLFVIPDYLLSDNNGGVSVVVAPATANPVNAIPPANIVPLPVAYYWLMGGGCLLMLIAFSRVRKSG
jgi:hypothetical protein